MVTHRDIRAFYDRLGGIEDWWSVFGDGAIDYLVRHGAFDSASAVVELGCGTGRLAARLLRHHLGPDCRYLGLDLSSTMVRRAHRRLRPWPDRAAIIQADAAPAMPIADAVCDRFIAAYVMEIFEQDEACAVMRDAHRILATGGLACLASLGQGQTAMSRLVCAAWNRLYTWRPTLVGGCRPIVLRAVLPAHAWAERHHEVIVRGGVPCEVVVAERL